MQKHDDIFAQRLMRMASEDSQRPAPGPQPQPLPLKQKTPPRKISALWVMAASGFLLISGSAFATIALMPDAVLPVVASAPTPAEPETKPQKSAPLVSADVQLTPNEIAKRAAFNKARADAIAADKRARLAALSASQTPVLKAAPEPEQMHDDLAAAMTYFPKAPTGWFALTPEVSPTTLGTGTPKAEKEKVGADHRAATEQALAQIASQYPGGSAALEAHPRFRDVKDYVNSQPVLRKFHGKGTHKAKALYIGQDGSYLKVGLTFVEPADFFGPADNSNIWGDAIVDRLSKKYGSKGIPTSFIGYHGGVAYSDTTSLTEVKQATMGTGPERFDMVLALNHGTQITLYGEISPDHLKRFLRSFDHDALLTRVNQIEG